MLANPHVIQVEYDWDERRRWGSKDKKESEDIVKSLLDLSGTMGQNRSTFFNQAYRLQHYPEVKYAGHLVQMEGFEKEDIVYEKFTLSLQEANRLAEVKEERYKDSDQLTENGNKEDLMRFLGTNRLRQVFSDQFFAEFDRLANLNHAIKTKKASHLNIDLVAVRHTPGSRQVRFCEVKKYNLKGTHEPITDDQLLVLGFVHHIIQSLGEGAFKADDKLYAVRTDLVIFVPNNDSRLLARLKTKVPYYPIQFAV